MNKQRDFFTEAFQIFDGAQIMPQREHVVVVVGTLKTLMARTEKMTDMFKKLKSEIDKKDSGARP